MSFRHICYGDRNAPSMLDLPCGNDLSYYGNDIAYDVPCRYIWIQSRVKNSGVLWTVLEWVLLPQRIVKFNVHALPSREIW